MVEKKKRTWVNGANMDISGRRSNNLIKSVLSTDFINTTTTTSHFPKPHPSISLLHHMILISVAKLSRQPTNDAEHSLWHQEAGEGRESKEMMCVQSSLARKRVIGCQLV